LPNSGADQAGATGIILVQTQQKNNRSFVGFAHLASILELARAWQPYCSKCSYMKPSCGMYGSFRNIQK
jgi:hypothetical protein